MTIIDTIKQCAEEKCRVKILYRKAAVDNSPHPRVIEPYSLTTGKQDTMLKAFQINPEEGWRFFMLHKIIEAKPLIQPFKPRGRISVHTGIVLKVYEPYESWTSAICEYRDMILDILSDMSVSDAEREALVKFRLENHINDAQMLSVHGSLFSNCLVHVLTDGLIDTEEKRIIRDLHACLQECGMGII